LFEGSFELFDGLLGKNVNVAEVVGIVEALVSELKDSEACIVVGEKPACCDIPLLCLNFFQY